LKDYLIKFREIIPIFIVIAFSNVIIFAFIRWYFFIKLNIFEVKEELWTMWLPFVLPWISIFLFLRPKLRVLKFNL